MSTWAFLGSGVFEAWHDDVDARLLDGRSGPVLVAPTAAAHEGEATFESWANKGLEHYRRLGVEASVLPLRTRQDAMRPEIVAALDDAAMIFFSGGNPWRLSEAVRGTPFWGALVDRLSDGLAYAGCSAGVACLTERTFDSESEDMDAIFKPGIGHVAATLFSPHWDMVDTWIPGATAFIAGSVGPGETLVAIDEHTAMVGDGESWEVSGVGEVHLMRDGAWSHHAAGARFEHRLPTAG